MKSLGIKLLRRLLGPSWMRRGWLGVAAARVERAHLRRTDLPAFRVLQGRSAGVIIGEDCRLFSLNIYSEPFLVEIGRNVIVSGNVSFITHDGAVFVHRDEIPGITGHYGKIQIGDNTFVGMGATILPNVSIGKNCVVAAGAVVFESFPDDSVIMGNPAKRVFSTSVYVAMKKTSPHTIVDQEFEFPRKYPADRLRDRIDALPVRAPRRSADGIRG